VHIRALAAEDANACAALAVERGWRPHVESFRLALSLGSGLGVDDPIGGLAAMAILLRYGVAAAVLTVLVGPRHVGKKLGRTLTERQLDAAGELPVELHAPPSGVGFALKLGFQPADWVNRFGGRPRTMARGEAGGTLRPVSGSDFPALVGMDEVAFGALRRPLLEALFPLAARACLAVADKRTVGYGLAWSDGDLLAIGPIVSEDEATAVAMASWLVGAGDREVRVDVPAERAGLASFAHAAGLKPLGRITRLVRGTPAASRRERLHALAAPWAG
jgi:hypothetical protein